MTAAAQYARVSSTKQLKGDGPDRQAFATGEYADRHGLALPIDMRSHLVQSNDGYTIENYPFIDDVTGSKDTVDRPGWNAIIAHCREHNIRTILIEKIDRLQREPIVGEMLLMQCREHGIALIDCSTGMNFAQESEDPYVRFLQRILRDAAAFNKDVMVHQTRKARQRKRDETGKCEGPKGYRERPEWAPVVARIDHMAQTHSHEAIASTLNSEGIRTLKGGQWKRGTIHRLLKCPAKMPPQ